MLRSQRLNGDPGLLAAAADSPALRRGSGARSSVARLQRILIDLGFDMPRSMAVDGSTDGVFGSETETVVKLFQATCQLSADGVVGRDTLAALDAILVAKYLANVATYRAAWAAGLNWGSA